MSSIAPARTGDPMLALRVDHLWERLGWFLRLRWIAIAGVTCVLVFSWRLGAVANVLPLAVVAVLLLVANLAWTWWRRVDQRPRGLDALEDHAVAQLLGDTAALAALLHWSDGVENPFAMFFAFPVTIAAKILRPGKAFAVAGAVVAIHSTVVLGEHFGVLAHHPLFILDESGPDELIGSGMFVSGYLLAFGLTIVGTAHFVSSATRRFQEELGKRARIEQVAASRERLAHLGELSAGVAHSTRNPLHGVLNCVDILRTQISATPETTETLELMEEGLRRIETLTQRLLTFARDTPVQFRPTDLSELVGESVRFLRPGAVGRHLHVVPVAPLVALVDSDRMCEALANVLDNALDATGGEGRVTVRVYTEPDGRAACIEVHDTGEGIPPEHLGRVFDPFFTTKAVGEGTGLGLAITRRIVEDHGGTVLIESDAEGTRVRFVLPLAPNFAEAAK